MQLDALQTLALSVAQARSPDQVLKEMVQGLGMTEGVALARVWLIERDESEGAFLHLRASVGFSVRDPSVRWNRTDGGHARIPLSYGKVGRIAARGQPLLLQRTSGEWLVQPQWAREELIESFAGQPLVFKGEILGVVALFSRKRIEANQLGWLRVFADHAAVAIANARAFQEITELRERLEGERQYLRHEVRAALHHGEIVAESESMRRVLDECHAVARSDSSVLILGESGVGKELIASAIHDSSARSDGPLVKVNCASVPRELFESEFFGHVKGAFSGALRERAGRFQLANGGTLFLDEVGEIPLELQGKLLRVLQEREFEPVGDDRTRRVDVRVIAATNRDLARDVAAGRFRSDLYYRLAIVPIEVPPLRDRPEDIVPLAVRFLQSISRRLNVSTPSIGPDDVEALLGYDYPGNIRELHNMIERAVVMHQSGAKTLILPLASPRISRTRSLEVAALDAPSDVTESAAVIPASRWKELEKQNVLNALRKAGGRIAGSGGAAALLEMKPTTLAYRMKALGIDRPMIDADPAKAVTPPGEADPPLRNGQQ